MSTEPSGVPGEGICVMGRRAFGTGIGHLTESLFELLARKYDVRLWDLHTPAQAGETVCLTSGREISLTHELEGFAVYIYADVLWNGVNYTKYVAPPSSGYRFAYLAFDSDRLPPEWVEILNRDFDAVFFTSAHLIDIALDSGVKIEIGALPLAIDVEAQIARKYRPVAGRRVRFGTLSAYHPRKGLEALVSAFLREFGDSHDAELVIHSNVAHGATATAVRSMVDVARTGNVVLSTDNLTESAKNELLESFDVYVNASAGEGYSVGPREALALGKSLVITDLGAHRPLFGPPGVFEVSTLHDAPAIYPEIDNRQFGFQRVPDPESLRSGLRAAFDFVRSDEAVTSAGERKLLAAEFGLQSLERSYWALVDPDSRNLLRGNGSSRHTQIPVGHQERIRRHGGRHGIRLGSTKIVVPAHDGGFFSLYNTYVSHLVWSLHDSPQRLVLPDWDAGRLLERINPRRPVSYCYSRPDQGNLWNHLFEPPYDLSAADLDDREFLWDGSQKPAAEYNESREPLLTYIHAYRLYQSPDFARIRRQYEPVIRDHIRLRQPLQAELDGFLHRNRDGRFLVAAHIKHPSHAVEQPDGTIADRHAYVELVRQAVAERGISEASDDWAVFLATEQERVVELFREEFGDHVIQFADVQRIPSETDSRFDELRADEKLADGHQLQHIMASDVGLWSPRLAWEVIRDARVMASADVVFHAVSNVATAVSFMSNGVDMRFASA
ncbi:glycosyltransferase [Cellulomonas sp. KRMCY2]|uniref:glycosyltransferase n=1 Tax=Cellulomonas sp. KRMCY2 TaxID=1304865 RepID=UPI00045E76F1|nr:glycosyltransferase [Cellulomonas sp. KRMCY2]